MTKLLRLRKEEIKTIKTLITQNLGECEIYIFGSRTDLNKKGGDVDIYIIPKNRVKFEQKLRLATELEDALLRPVDLIISSNPNRPIEIEAKKGVKIL